MSRLPVRSLALPLVLAVGALMLAGCSTPPSTASSPAGGPVRIVASTDVYGDIAKRIGGNDVAVTSIISDPNQDPHSYEADAQVQLSLSQASVVLQNGGGYDDFVRTLLRGAKNPHVVVLDAADISGKNQKPASGSFNEHLWYDFPTMKKVADKLESVLSARDPKHAARFRSNADAFDAQLGQLEQREATIRKSANGVGAAITEPVPLYLLEASGIVDKTPAAFSEAIEQGTDVSPLVLKTTLDLFRTHAVKLLAYNEQTTGPETKAVLAAATKANIAVIPVTETLPAGKDYIEWMTGNLEHVAAAVK